MVDVGYKEITKRFAKAKARVYVGKLILNLIKSNEIGKGDVLTVAQLAGISAAKRTSEIIPLCHNVPLTSVHVKFELNEDHEEVIIYTKAKCDGKTGVEMEAMVAASTAALTIYDMCKAISHDITIKEVQLMEKAGGKYHFVRKHDKEQGKNVLELKFNTDPIIAGETFAPGHI